MLLCVGLIFGPGSLVTGLARCECTKKPSKRFARLSSGTWVSKPFIVTRERLRAEWGAVDWATQRQWNKSWKEVDQVIAGELAETRMLQVASYDWRSDLDDQPLSWNGTELVLRALNSERGIVMIGGAKKLNLGDDRRPQIRYRSRRTTCYRRT